MTTTFLEAFGRQLAAELYRTLFAGAVYATVMGFLERVSRRQFERELARAAAQISASPLSLGPRHSRSGKS